MPKSRRFSEELSFVASLEDPSGALFCSIIEENPSIARLRLELSASGLGHVTGSIELLVTSEQLHTTINPQTPFTDLARTPVHFVETGEGYRVLFEVATGPVLVSFSARIDPHARDVLTELLDNLS